jgi:hypothetical protein
VGRGVAGLGGGGAEEAVTKHNIFFVGVFCLFLVLWFNFFRSVLLIYFLGGVGLILFFFISINVVTVFFESLGFLGFLVSCACKGRRIAAVGGFIWGIFWVGDDF